ncbi:MAG: thioredoxin domain-containing protein, partial [Acidobacteriaceae bacterium]|nr:thioredoxin domain-containing protein [Acidobacteriaceae bacterium]
LAVDTTQLKPPKGARVAILVFEDLQCPTCAHMAPILEEASRTYHIPLVHYDYPLKQHSWSYQAAVLARYFDTKSQKLGDEFRAAVFAHQAEITPENLHPLAEKFAAEHKVSLPFVLDPRGELDRKVKADQTFGEKIKIEHTPTIFIATTTSRGTVEVTDNSRLYATIDDMVELAKAEQPPATKSGSARKGRSIR